jgi:Right handed beta helix region
VRLQAGGDYWVDGTLVLNERHRLRIEGNGARMFAGTRGALHRGQIRIIGGSDMVVRNLEIRGAHPHAGLEDRAYVPALEGQYGIRLDGATDVEIDRVRIHDVYGDFVDVSRHEGDRRWSERVWIHDSSFARNGRQGIAVVAGRDVVIERNTFTDTRRATIDLEPNAPSWGADNIHILDNEVGPGRLLFVAAGGRGPVNRVVVARNVLRGHLLNF